ncbi:methylamine dehydrogenase accessory protein MauD [Paraburkholderia adhaesiva]|uniref:methylamine dehydrogenase accessory protein MauD n=1 Tax=Paraburkholderia adhaesiva TaxID=2883244 RepID=UPI001F2049C8|nr:methylamine dehydrogenase accessory protein MauD [Paraburkholderia adhaesiva]
MMLTALIVSSVLLWIGLLLVALVGLAVIRQVGILHERISPVGALMIDKGPAVGTVGPSFEVRDITSKPVKIGGVEANGNATLVFFLSTTCPICKKLLPLLNDIVRKEGPRLRLVLVSDGDLGEHQAFYEKQRLSAHPYVLSQDIGMAYQIGKLPYAILFDAQGVIRAKGLVNSREQLESLFVANERGVGSLQEYLRAQAD